MPVLEQSELLIFSSLMTLVHPTKIGSSRFDTASDDRATDKRMHSETELVYHARGHDAESNPFPYGERTIAMDLKR